jgi:hypothetical protein
LHFFDTYRHRYVRKHMPAGQRLDGAKPTETLGGAADFRFAIALCFPKFVKEVPQGAQASERGTNTSMLASIRRRRSRADPQAFIPANRMPYAGIANAGATAPISSPIC